MDVLPLAALLLTGCWKPYAELTVLDFTTVPFESVYVASEDAVIRLFDKAELECPDGAKARFFGVYRTTWSQAGSAVPVAIVLHSGAFDYVLNPSVDDYLQGTHYRTESRLTRTWSVEKVWETLGQHPGVVDADEENLGTLPAALVNAGVFQIYPGNCWGDLWHNQEGNQDNSYEDDHFFRNGLTLAWWMSDMLVNSQRAHELGFEVEGVTLDPNRLYLIGLGEGGRGVVELLLHEERLPPEGVLVDSSPDYLGPFLEDQGFADEAEGIGRIFGEENLDGIEQWSLATAMEQERLPDRVAYVYSDVDPRLPSEAVTYSAEALDAAGVGWVHNTGEGAHVYTNADYDLAQAVVTYLMEGVVPSGY